MVVIAMKTSEFIPCLESNHHLRLTDAQQLLRLQLEWQMTDKLVLREQEDTLELSARS